MSFDTSTQTQAQAEQNRKKKEKSEKQEKLEKQAILEQEEKKKQIRENEDKTEDVLHKLEDMLEEDLNSLDSRDMKLIKKAIEWWDITKEEIEDILNKIEEIESNEKVDKYLPKEFRITAEDYKQSLVNWVKRLQIITKLDTSLTILAKQINPESSMWLNLFSWYMAILDKNLVKIQENTIDTSDSLKNLEKKKNPPKKENLSLWERFVRFLREIFSN